MIQILKKMNKILLRRNVNVREDEQPGWVVRWQDGRESWEEETGG